VKSWTAAIQEFDRTHVRRWSLGLRHRSLLECIDGHRQSLHLIPRNLNPSCSHRHLHPARNEYVLLVLSPLAIQHLHYLPQRCRHPLELVPEHFYDASMTSGYTQTPEYSFAQKPNLRCQLSLSVIIMTSVTCSYIQNFTHSFLKKLDHHTIHLRPASVDNSVDMFLHNCRRDLRSSGPSIPPSLKTGIPPHSPFSSSPSRLTVFANNRVPA